METGPYPPPPPGPDEVGSREPGPEVESEREQLRDVPADEPSDRPASAGDVFGEPGGVPPGEKAFRIVELRQHLDGRVDARLQATLTTKIYRKDAAVRYGQYYAKRLVNPQSVLVVLSPAGHGLEVIAAGTGKRVKPRIARRAKRLVRELLPQYGGGAKGSTGRKRRTSRRPTNGASKPRKRRTSRRKGR